LRVPWRNGRCFHQIRYADGSVDAIHFEVYHPEEMRTLCLRAGLEPGREMVRWTLDSRPNGGSPRYQLVCARP